MVGNSDQDREIQLASVRREAAGCVDCPLWETGAQTVFGAGPATANLMFVGEAPGQHEDRTGTPFVGPAGRLFDELLIGAGIDRASVFVTNVVKHRPSVQTNGRRKNRAPKQSEIKACAKWLDREIAIVQPRVMCCLGAVAAKRVLGKEFRLTEQRGQWFATAIIPHVLATVHPSFILIQPAETSERWLELLRSDLLQVRQRLDSLA